MRLLMLNALSASVLRKQDACDAVLRGVFENQSLGDANPPWRLLVVVVAYNADALFTRHKSATLSAEEDFLFDSLREEIAQFFKVISVGLLPVVAGPCQQRHRLRFWRIAIWLQRIYWDTDQQYSILDKPHPRSLFVGSP